MLLSTVGSFVSLVGILLCGYKTFYLTTPIQLLTDIWVVFSFGPREKYTVCIFTCYLAKHLMRFPHLFT